MIGRVKEGSKPEPQTCCDSAESRVYAVQEAKLTGHRLPSVANALGCGIFALLGLELGESSDLSETSEFWRIPKAIFFMESVTTQGLFLFDSQFRSWGTVNSRFLGSWKQGPRGQRFDFGQT